MLAGRRTFERAHWWDGRHPFDVTGFVLTHEVPHGWLRPGSTVSVRHGHLRYPVRPS